MNTKRYRYHGRAAPVATSLATALFESEKMPVPYETPFESR